MPGGAPRIEIPRWIQLVGLPIMLLLAWVVAGAVRHVVFVFVVASLVALLLNPIVRALGRIWIPRGFAVAIVYLTFAAVLVVSLVAVTAVVVDQTRSASDRVEAYLTDEDGQTGLAGAEIYGPPGALIALPAVPPAPVPSSEPPAAGRR